MHPFIVTYQNIFKVSKCTSKADADSFHQPCAEDSPRQVASEPAPAWGNQQSKWAGVSQDEAPQ